jgi:hypothetical protein
MSTVLLSSLEMLFAELMTVKEHSYDNCSTLKKCGYVVSKKKSLNASEFGLAPQNREVWIIIIHYHKETTA